MSFVHKRKREAMRSCYLDDCKNSMNYRLKLEKRETEGTMYNFLMDSSCLGNLYFRHSCQLCRQSTVQGHLQDLFWLSL